MKRAPWKKYQETGEMARVRSRHNNLLNYFIHDKRDLSPTYVASCEKYLEEISYKLQAASAKLQAPGGLSLNTIKRYKQNRKKYYENK